MADDPGDRFYVGYLPLPRVLGPRVLGVALVGVLLAMAVGYAWIAEARDPGSGTWDTSRAIELEGFLTAEPYPVLQGVTWDGEDLGTVLLVSEGKIGAQDRLGDAAGSRAVAKGYLIRRGELSMLELVGGFHAVERARTLQNGTPALPETSGPVVETISLRGEIVDPKCYLGVMLPGEGRTHKACAALCILGGIPPLFEVTTAGGEKFVYLLLGPDGEPLPRGAVADLAGEPVMASGSLSTWGDLAVFSVDIADIVPTGPQPIALNSSN